MNSINIVYFVDIFGIIDIEKWVEKNKQNERNC